MSTRPLPCAHAASGSDWLHEELQRAAEIDLGDFLRFEIAVASKALRGPPRGGASYPVVVRLGGKEFGRFRLDAGFGDALFGVPEELVGDEFLAFAGLGPARVRAIRRDRHGRGPDQLARRDPRVLPPSREVSRRAALRHRGVLHGARGTAAGEGPGAVHLTKR